jgi:hypothetical protein
MWRRRVVRRTLRRTAVAGRISARPMVNPMLLEANRSFSNGNYHRAGELYEQIARNAMAQDRPRAPHFWVQAGRSFFLVKDPQRGYQDAQQGLLLLVEQKRYADLARVGENIMDWLNANGFRAEANQLKYWLDQNSKINVDKVSAPSESLKLPSACPSCGAPLHEEDVTWQEDGSAICNYCTAVMNQNG